MRILLLVVCFHAFTLSGFAQNIGIGTDTPHEKAILDLESSDKGLLLPRLTQAEIDAMGELTAGLMFYNTDAQCFQYYSGTAWVRLCADAPPCPSLAKPTASSNSPVDAGESLTLTTAEVEGASYLWTGPNGFAATTREVTIASATLADAGEYILRLSRLGCFSEPDTVTVVIIPVLRSCAELLATVPTLTDGVYVIDADGAGPRPPFDCYCDMTTDGGGWTLVLNYLRPSGISPNITLRNLNLPLLGSTVLGTNEVATAFWGQAGIPMMNTLPFTELRFFGRTSLHNRVIHFTTEHAGTVAYFNTGMGSASGLESEFTPLPEHTANLPGTAINFMTGQGDFAMTFYPFSTNESPPGFWGIQVSGSWQVDDASSGSNHDTHHQIWIR